MVWRLPIGHMPPLAGGMQCPLIAGSRRPPQYRREAASCHVADAGRAGVSRQLPTQRRHRLFEQRRRQ
jgi:hypothetical protein